MPQQRWDWDLQQKEVCGTCQWVFAVHSNKGQLTGHGFWSPTSEVCKHAKKKVSQCDCLTLGKITHYMCAIVLFQSPCFNTPLVFQKYYLVFLLCLEKNILNGRTYSYILLSLEITFCTLVHWIICKKKFFLISQSWIEGDGVASFLIHF